MVHLLHDNAVAAVAAAISSSSGRSDSASSSRRAPRLQRLSLCTILPLDLSDALIRGMTDFSLLYVAPMSASYPTAS